MADAGKIVITPKGAYSSTKTYEWLDEVSYNGNAYVALKTVTGVTPSDDGVNWRLFMSSTDVDANVLVPKFTEASTRINIVSGENLSTMFGKIKKWFTDLKSHAFKDLVNNLTTSTTGSALDASQGKVLQDEVDGVNRNLSNTTNGVVANMFKPTLGTTTVNGITFTKNGDGTYTLSGTATADTYVPLSDKLNYLKLPCELKLVGCPTGGSDATFQLYDNFNANVFDKGNGVIATFTLQPQIYIMVKKNTVCNNLIFKPMLTHNLNATYDDFVRYTGNTGRLNEEVAAQNESLDTLEYSDIAGGKNIANPDNFEDGKVVSYDSGAITDNSLYFISGYIQIEPSTKYTKQGFSSTGENWYYDENKNPISMITSDTFTTPYNAKYVLLSGLKSKKSVCMLEKGSTATTYEPFIQSVKMLDENVSALKKDDVV